MSWSLHQMETLRFIKVLPLLIVFTILSISLFVQPSPFSNLSSSFLLKHKIKCRFVENFYKSNCSTLLYPAEIPFHECVSFRRTNCPRSRETLPRGSFPPRRVLLRLSGESAGVQSHAAAKRLLPQTPCPHSRRLGLPSPPPGVLCPAREAPPVPRVRHREADDASRVGDRRCSKPRVMLGRFSPFSF